MRAQNDSSSQTPQSDLLARILVVGTVHQLLYELHTIEIHELDILFHATIKWKAHLPRSRKNVRVFDRGLVHNMVGTDRSIPLDQVQGIAVVIPRAIKPSPGYKPCGVNDQRISFKMPVRPAHPTIGRGILGSVFIIFFHVIVRRACSNSYTIITLSVL